MSLFKLGKNSFQVFCIGAIIFEDVGQGKKMEYDDGWKRSMWLSLCLMIPLMPRCGKNMANLLELDF